MLEELNKALDIKWTCLAVSCTADNVKYVIRAFDVGDPYECTAYSGLGSVLLFPTTSTRTLERAKELVENYCKAPDTEWTGDLFVSNNGMEIKRDGAGYYWKLNGGNAVRARTLDYAFRASSVALLCDTITKLLQLRARL